MVCKQCGMIIPDSMNRCQRCGASISGRETGRSVSAMRQGAPRAEDAPASRPQQEPTGNAVQREVGEYSELKNQRRKAAGSSTLHQQSASERTGDRASRKAEMMSLRSENKAVKEAMNRAKAALKKARIAENTAFKAENLAIRARRKADAIGNDRSREEAILLTRKAAGAKAAAEMKKNTAR